MKTLDEKKSLIRSAISAIDDELITNREGLIEKASRSLILHCKHELERFLQAIETGGQVGKIARESGMGRAISDSFPAVSPVGDKILAALQACKEMG